MAVIQPKQAYNPYQDPRYNPYNNQNPYMNQNPYANQNQYGQMNQYNGQYNSSLGQSKVCGKCGASVGADTDFCPFCGAFPIKFCPKCFKEIDDDGEVCSDCGTELLPFESFKKYYDLKENAVEYLNYCDFDNSIE